MKDIELITRFISSWMWHSIGMSFLVGATVLFAFSKGIWGVSLIMVMVFCEVMAWIRQKETYNIQLNN